MTVVWLCTSASVCYGVVVLEVRSSFHCTPKKERGLDSRRTGLGHTFSVPVAEDDDDYDDDEKTRRSGYPLQSLAQHLHSEETANTPLSKTRLNSTEQ